MVQSYGENSVTQIQQASMQKEKYTKTDTNERLILCVYICIIPIYTHIYYIMYIYIWDKTDTNDRLTLCVCVLSLYTHTYILYDIYLYLGQHHSIQPRLVLNS